MGCRLYFDDDPGVVDAAPPTDTAPPPDEWPDIIDCWSTYSCHDGDVYATFGSDSSDDETCGYGVVYECANGCDAEWSELWEDEIAEASPEQLCAGAADRQVGDACWYAASCWPTHAVAQPDGSVTQVYLTCDSTLHQCVETSAPTLERWLEPCGPQRDVPSEFHGWAEGGFYGACLIDRTAAGCSMSGTTKLCNGDWDCPIGATCDHSLPTTSWVPRAVCRPGARGLPLDLGC